MSQQIYYNNLQTAAKPPQFPDGKDSGYTEINAFSYSTFKPTNTSNTESECTTDIDMDNDSDSFEEKNDFSQTCDDDASDFYPSDPEDLPYISAHTSIEQKRKRYQTRGLKIFRDLTENLSAPWRNELDGGNAFLSNMYKFNDEKKRWVKKGPIVIFILPNQFRLVTYNLYGQQAPSLNIKLWEFMSKYYKTNSNMLLFNSFGRNFKNKVYITTSTVYLKDIVDATKLTPNELSLIQTEKVNICNSTVVPYPEMNASKILFVFKLEEDLKRFKMAFDKVCNDLFIFNCQKRYNTYINKQSVLNFQEHMTDKFCQYPYVNNELFMALAKYGYEYRPMEDENGEIHNSRVVCSYCGASYDGWFTDCKGIEVVHREHANAKLYKCPFVY